jgi:UDP-GlcNAc3NAcA epimerase
LPSETTSRSKPLRLVTILGARPQFVKAFPLSHLLRADARFEEIIVHTGQHFDPAMSDIFFSELGLETPRHFLDIHGGGHGAMTGRMMEAIEHVLAVEKPDAVIVYGDTNSTLAGALAAAKLKLPVVHIEAGLRSRNRRMPEEINRVVVDHVSSVLLCPTLRAVQNLKTEGITGQVHLVGDLTFDATAIATPFALAKSQILKQLGLNPKTYGIATFHREENLSDGEQLQKIVALVRTEAQKRPIVVPLHPRTRETLKASHMDLNDRRLMPIEPLGYLDMCQLVHFAQLILTDSGGLQKEAYLHRVPCVTLRAETEWEETIEYGWNRLWTEPEYRERKEIPAYGTEPAAGKIIDALAATLS